MGAELLEPPAWLLDGPRASEVLREPPDCPCCWEPPADPEPVRWTVPGVWDDDVEAAPPAPSPTVTGLMQAVAALGALDPTTQPGGQAMVDLDALLQAEQALRLVKLRALADARARNVQPGTPSLSTWLRRHHPESATSDAVLADKVRRFPLLQEAMDTGRLGPSVAGRVARALAKVAPHVDRPDGLVGGQPGEPVIDAVIGNTLDLVARATLSFADPDDADDPRLDDLREELERIRCSGSDQLGRVEASLVLLAERVPGQVLARQLAEQLAALLPDELERQAEEAHRRRSLSLAAHPDRPGGEAAIRADAELWELLWTVLAAEARRDPANPDDTSALADLRAAGPEALADAVDRALVGQDRADWSSLDDGGVRRPRTRGQRLHDALLLALRRYVAAGLGGSHDKAPVTMVVTIPVDRVEGRPGALPAVGDSGSLLPAGLVREWWCDATVTPYVLSRDRVPIGQVHGQRTLTAAERRAARIQHGGRCAGMGCCRPDDPLAFVVPHHQDAWAEHGTTSLGRSLLVCRKSHHDLHHGRPVQLRNGDWIDERGPCDPPGARPWGT